MVTTKIQIKDHLAEYINSKYYEYFDTDHPELGGCVMLPDKLDLYHTIWNLLEKRPIGRFIDEGNVTIGLPSRRIGKDPEYYNYIGVRSVKIINKRIETMFYAELRQMLDDNKHQEGIEHLDTVHEFINKYRIESLSSDAMIKDFYRWRDLIRKRKRKRPYNKA